MTIQQTLESLIKELPHNEAAELRALIQSWPINDAELQQLIESNAGELLQLLQPSQSSPGPDYQTNRINTTKLPDLSHFAPLARLN